MPLTAALIGIVTSVVVFTPWTGDAFGLPKLTILFLAAVAGWGLVLAPPGGRKAPLVADVRRAPVAIAVAAYTAAVLLTSITSSARADSFLGRYERYGGFVPLLVQLALASLVYAACAGRPERLRSVGAAVLGGACACAVYVLAQTIGGDPLDWRDASGNDVRYQAGTIGNSNFTGAFLAIALAFVPALWQGVADVRARAAVAFGGATCAAGVLATQSRGGLLAAAAVAAVLGASHGPAIVRAMRPALRVVLAAGVAAVAVGVYVLATTTSLGRSESLDVRARQWRAAAAIARDHPIVGTGPDTFQLYFPEYRSEEDGRLLGLQLADKPHNSVLEHAQSMGIVGLAAYVFLLASVARVAIRGVRAAGDRTLPTAFAAAAAGHAAQSQFSVDVVPLAMTWWLAVAGIASVGAREPAAATARARRVRVPAVAVVLVAAALAWVGTRPWRADWASASGDHDRAVQLNPTQAVLHLARGDAATVALAEATARQDAVDALEEGRGAYDHAVRLQRRSVYAAVGRANLEAFASRLDPSSFRAADEWFARAVELDPHDWDVYRQWGEVLRAWAAAAGGDADLQRRAAEAFARAKDIRPEFVPPAPG